MKKPRQGMLQLVLIGSAALAAGCTPHPDDVRESMSRARYSSLEDCSRDWYAEDCESNGVRGYYGPYYSSNRVYHYDGRITPMMEPRAARGAVEVARLSPHEVYQQPGKYATTKAHGQATGAKLAAARSGGFGSTGRGFSGGG